MFIRRSVSVGRKIGSNIFKCGQLTLKRAVFPSFALRASAGKQQRPPADKNGITNLEQMFQHCLTG
jgi:hypothetical protein